MQGQAKCVRGEEEASNAQPTCEGGVWPGKSTCSVSGAAKSLAQGMRRGNAGRQWTTRAISHGSRASQECEVQGQALRAAPRDTLCKKTVATIYEVLDMQ